MRAKYLLLMPWLLLAREYHDPAGFRADLPEGWRAIQSKAGHFVLVSPDPRRYVFVQPVLNRTADCVATLRQTLAAGGQFAGAQQPQVLPAGRGQAVARFVFQNGQVRGQMMCAETSRRGGMFYGVAAPVNEFSRDLPRLVAVLKSFSFEASRGGGGVAGGGVGGVAGGGAGGGAAGGGTGTGTGGSVIPALVGWREPQEMAYTMSVPQGWRISGGIQRQDVTHYTDGTQSMSPDGASVVRQGDTRVRSCTVPGPGAASMPNGGRFEGFCALQSGSQFASGYLQMLARDLGIALRPNGVQMVDRPDLAQQADEMPRSMGLGVQSSAVEVRFSGTRNGAPVAGALMARTTLFRSVQGQNFLLGTQTFGVRGFAGPPEQFGMLARLTGAMAASIRINPTWWAQTQQINRQVADATLATMRHQAESQQRSFWERMDASDRRRDAVNDILGGTVRLSDGQGRQYEAKAGSNYYFRDDDAARRVGRPDDAVVGADVWPSPMVDLTPLEVIR